MRTKRLIVWKHRAAEQIQFIIVERKASKCDNSIKSERDVSLTTICRRMSVFSITFFSSIPIAKIVFRDARFLSNTAHMHTRSVQRNVETLTRNGRAENQKCKFFVARRVAET